MTGLTTDEMESFVVVIGNDLAYPKTLQWKPSRNFRKNFNRPAGACDRYHAFFFFFFFVISTMPSLRAVVAPEYELFK